MLSFLAYFYLSLVVLTSRIRVTSQTEQAISALREGRAAVYTFWYEHIFFLLYYFGLRKLPILMTPQGKDDNMTVLARMMGLRVAKGSLEGGGRHALITLLEQLKSGTPILIAADGPRGPEKKCKAGCFILAQESEAPIIPVVWRARFQLKFRKKQGAFYFPLPFNSIEIKLGVPLPIARHYQFQELESIKRQLAQQLDRL